MKNIKSKSKIKKLLFSTILISFGLFLLSSAYEPGIPSMAYPEFNPILILFGSFFILLGLPFFIKAINTYLKDDNNPTKRMLIVDDDFASRTLLKRTVESISLDIEILVVEDGDKAIDLIRSMHGRFDLVSTDINHLGIYGLELAKIVKQDYPHIKVLICSGYASALDSGDWGNYIDRFLPKPFDVEEYKSIVKKFLNF